MAGPALELHVKLGMTLFDTTFSRCRVVQSRDLIVQAAPGDTVQAVRERALRQLAVSVAHGELHHQGAALDPRQTLAEAGLADGARLYLFYSVPRGWE